MLSMKCFSRSLIAGILVFVAPSAFALPACPLLVPGSLPAIICIDDLGDGLPIVTTNIPGASIGVFDEGATVIGFAPLIDGLLTPRSWALAETAGDFNPPNSDVATLFGGAAGSAFDLEFRSDIFSSPPIIGFLQGSLVEDGTSQLMAFDTNLNVFVRSDITSPEGRVPEPSTIFVLLSGLAVLGLIRMKRSF